MRLFHVLFLAQIILTTHNAFRLGRQWQERVVSLGTVVAVTIGIFASTVSVVRL